LRAPSDEEWNAAFPFDSLCRAGLSFVLDIVVRCHVANDGTLETCKVVEGLDTSGRDFAAAFLNLTKRYH
jgi:hypothetical protein